jgi:hypothetical protein
MQDECSSYRSLGRHCPPCSSHRWQYGNCRPHFERRKIGLHALYVLPILQLTQCISGHPHHSRWCYIPAWCVRYLHGYLDDCLHPTSLHHPLLCSGNRILYSIRTGSANTTWSRRGLSRQGGHSSEANVVRLGCHDSVHLPAVRFLRFLLQIFTYR